MTASYLIFLYLFTITLNTIFPYAVQTNKNTENKWLKFYSESTRFKTQSGIAYGE